MALVLWGTCPECSKFYRMKASSWVYAHLSDPSAWPMRVTLPCGHVLSGVDEGAFEETSDDE